MSNRYWTRTFVGLTGLAALVVLGLSWLVRLPFPGFWEISSFLLIALLLEHLSTELRAGASGSISFVMHLSGGVLFGGFWGAVIAALSMGISQIGRISLTKNIFNVSQVTLSVALSLLAYHHLGGSLPPGYLYSGGTVATAAVRQDLALFFLFAALYFGINSLLVSAAVSISTGQPIGEVWTLNTRGVLGYDLGASVIALFVAWAFARSQQIPAIGPLGLVVIIGPIVGVRHVYGMYHKLEESGRELLDVMVKAIEARDPYTSGHSIRVRDLSRAIALELGLPLKEVEQIETAALLHDVGKIHEEFAPLLRKESRLSQEETALMQTHSTKSADLVGIISKFRGGIQEAVRHHHERWDGCGYPAGLAATDIPLGARIILISDTIDAMTTDRPYRKRLPLEVVVAELQKCKGSQFDPSVVDIVVSSVAVRRLIVGPSASVNAVDPGHARSKRIGWPAAGLWRTRRA